jgi:Arc/MetJ-type ribon-helix-helix transcriptional regulator
MVYFFAMSTIDIHLSDALAEYLIKESRRRGYKDASEFVAAVLEAERFRNFSEELERSLEKTIKEPSTPLTDDDFDEVLREGAVTLKKRQAE